MSVLNEVRLAFECCLYHANSQRGFPVRFSKARVVLDTPIPGLSLALNIGMPLQHIAPSLSICWFKVSSDTPVSPTISSRQQKCSNTCFAQH